MPYNTPHRKINPEPKKMDILWHIMMPGRDNLNRGRNKTFLILDDLGIFQIELQFKYNSIFHRDRILDGFHCGSEP